MLCQNCGKYDATTHIKQIINGDMTESHLCSACAKSLGCDDMFKSFSLNLSDLFGGFFGDTLPALAQENTLRCKKCGSSFDDIAREGKLGCAECYRTFYDKMLPSLQRIHGRVSHSGKKGNAPVAPPAPEEPPQSKVEKLRAELTEAVSCQNFELAAKLRDEIKELEGGEAK